MRLHNVRILNCFGFADATIDLTPDLVYILGRNSSGKTALLDAINHLAPQRVPQSHPRFANFKATTQHPQLTGTFSITEAPTITASSMILGLLRGKGLTDTVLNAHTQLQEGLKQLDASYHDLAQQLAGNGTLTLTKFSAGGMQLTVGNDFTAATERRKTIEQIVNRFMPNGIFTAANANHQLNRITAPDLDRHAANVIPRITYYNEQYALGDDLPDYLTLANIEQSPNNVSRAFISTIDATDASALLTTHDPDEQDRLRQTLQERADSLATRISKQANRLLQITLTNTPYGIQITMRTDKKMSFYRLMSDATKLLFAYHLYALHHEPGAILLFDEPSRALHASATEYLRDLLTDLSTENHVILSTHSEHLINLDRLDGIRLMQQDDQQRPTVLNKLKPPRDKAGFGLALQPVFDAIGIAHTHHVLTNDKVVLTEGLSDYLYLRALHKLMNQQHTYALAPGRGDGHLSTIVPFFMSQGVRLKIILDHPQLQPLLQASYGIPDESFFLIPSDKMTRGIEDLFNAADFQRLLTSAGITTTIDELQYGNSTYAKATNLDKRFVAQEFLTNVATYKLDEFEATTRDNISALITFCADDEWFTIN